MAASIPDYAAYVHVSIDAVPDRSLSVTLLLGYIVNRTSVFYRTSKLRVCRYVTTSEEVDREKERMTEYLMQSRIPAALHVSALTERSHAHPLRRSIH